MPIPLVALAAGGLALLPHIADAVLSLYDLMEDADVQTRLQNLQFGMDATLAEVDGSTARQDLIKSDTANTLAHVLAHLPVADSGGGGGAVWDEVVGIFAQANVNMTARQAMGYLARMAEYWHLFGVTPMTDNPDFALAYQIRTRHLPAYSDYNPEQLRPRTRPAGQTVLQYLQNAQADKGWFAHGPVAARYIYEPATTNVAAWLVCLLQDAGQWADPADPRIDTLITRTTDTPAADAKILAADFSPAADVRIDELITRTADTILANDIITEVARPQILGAPIALAQSGEIDITGAVAILLTLDNISAGVGMRDLDPPVRYAKALGNITMGSRDGKGPTQHLEYVQTFALVPRDITRLYWHIYPPATGTLQVVERI